GLRAGDTPAHERSAVLRRPPHILVTTPESFFLLLTSPKFREKLASVRPVVVDELHEFAGNKRTGHLDNTIGIPAGLRHGRLAWGGGGGGGGDGRQWGQLNAEPVRNPGRISRRVRGGERRRADAARDPDRARRRSGPRDGSSDRGAGT